MNGGVSRMGGILTVVVTGLAAPAVALAQAWLPPKGDGSVTMGYQFYKSQDRFTTSDGERYYDGLTHQHGMVAVLTYGITDRLAVSVGLPPLLYTSYNGPDPHRWPLMDGNQIARDPSGRALFHPPTIDDGSYHGTFQNLSGQVSFMALQGSWVVTPFVGFQMPSHSYEYHAQTAVGRGLWELQVGASVGRLLDPVLPDAYFQGRYAFAYREAVQDLRFNYSFVNLELGYFLTPAVSLQVLGLGQFAHDGLKDEEYQLPGPPQDGYSLSEWVYLNVEDKQMRGQPGLPVALHHDQLNYSTSINLGVGVSFAVTPSLGITSQVFRTVWGRGGRPTDLAVGAWATFSFSVSDLFHGSSSRQAREAGPTLPATGERP
jgi:hypothetical protein